MKDWAYSLADDGLWVHIYGGNALQTRLADGSPLALSQESDYPWDGQVRLTIAAAPAQPFAIHLRIPGWTAPQADGITVRVNGEPVAARPQPGSYFEMRRTWSAGDTIELVLPVAVQLVEAHPLVEEARNQVAIMRGPVVYCLETVDTPGVALSECICRAMSTWHPCAERICWMASPSCRAKPAGFRRATGRDDCTGRLATRRLRSSRSR